MAIITSNVKLNNLIDYIDTISDAVVKNPLYTGAVEAFTTGLKDFSLTEQEQSVSFSEFIAKTYLGQLDIVSRTALAFDGELARVDKTKKEISLVNETTILTMEQINSERLRQLDTRANVNLKNQQVLVTHESAKTEETRRLVVLKSSNDNVKIKVGEQLVNYLKIISDDTDVAITSADIHTTIKTSILSIDDEQIIIDKNIPSESNYIANVQPILTAVDFTPRQVSEILVVT